MHGDRSQSAELSRRRHVAGNPSAEADVAEAAFAGHIEQSGCFFDLADYLSWRASGSLARSQCTLTCKWTYLAHELEGWQPDYLETIGLEDLVERGSLPERASPVGADVGRLTPEAAKALGLTTSCHVGAGLIDAYAGALGVLGGFAGDLSQIDHRPPLH